MKTALVLSGGGSKGSYEIGVWRALRRLHIKYDIVTGTSIGALNGALITQNTYFKAIYIWHKLNLEYLFEQSAASNQSFDVLKLFGSNFLKHGGMDITKVEDIIKMCINEKKFYNSKIDYGLVTYNFSTKKALCLKKKQIKKERLVDYLMASATCFPAFQMKEIDGEKFIDGGFYDNLPINLALDMGAEKLIVIDLRAPGFKKRPKNKKDMIYITPRNNISFFLNFNEDQARENMNFGYNDTMKVFKKLDGNIFTFKKGGVEKYYNIYKEKLEKAFKKKVTQNYFLKMIETIGREFALREDKIYRMSSFFKELQKKVGAQDAISKEVKKQIKSKSIKKMTNTKTVTLYFLGNLEKGKKDPIALTGIFPKSHQQALFLHMIGVHYGK